MPSTDNTHSQPNPFRLLENAMSGLDPRKWSTENPTEAVAMGIHALRSGLFVAESIPLFWLQRPQSGSKTKPPSSDALELTLARLRELLERDAQLIGQGLAPLSVFTPRDPLSHGSRLLRILADAQRVSARKRKRNSKDFSREAKPFLDELPAYYRRNFHYQTDGYLSETSAELYEHQVELLFRGGADAMRRMIIPPLNQAFRDMKGEIKDGGQGLRILEVGSGAGTATQSVARAFPKAKITCLDLSYPYTRHARKQLRDFPRVECVQGDAANLEFADERFDAVFSVFLYHELPLPVREQVLEEAFRVLKPGGVFSFVDSLQKGDDTDLDWALEFFPREFHEPYYANYAANPMEALIKEAGFETIENGTGYLAKWASARKPEAKPMKARKTTTRKTTPKKRARRKAKPTAK
ncbi:MAG: methyltransferase domain-containing protein [Myxococcota bacterium]